MHYWHKVKGGRFVLRHGARGWAIWFDDQALSPDCYPTAQHALDDLAGGHCDWPSLTDPSSMGLPDEIGDWSQDFSSSTSAR